MAAAQTLKGTKRELRGKGYLNELRRGQMIPSVVYGQGRQPLPIALEEEPLIVYSISMALVDCSAWNWKAKLVLSWFWSEKFQRHPVNREINHLDLLAVSMTEKITSTVPIQIIGEEEVVKQGAVLQVGAKKWK